MEEQTPAPAMPSKDRDRIMKVVEKLRAYDPMAADAYSTALNDPNGTGVTEEIVQAALRAARPSRHPNARYRLCLTPEDLQELCAELAAAPLIGYDTETSGLDLYGDKAGRICGFCFSTAPFTGWYVPIRHQVADGYLDPRQLDAQLVIDTLRPFLETKPLVGFNSKFDFGMSAMEGITCNFVHDPLFQVSLSGRYMPGQRGLKQITKALFGWESMEIHEVMPLAPAPGKRKPEIAFHKYDIEAALDYAAADADWTLQIHHRFLPELMQVMGHDPSLVVTDVLGQPMPYIYWVEMQLMPVVAAMEMQGVPVDTDYLDEMAAQCARAIVKVEESTKRAIWDLYGEEFDININSNPQLLDLFTNKLGSLVTIPNEPGQDAPKKTATGNISLDGSVLELMAKEHTWVSGITTYKGLRKLHSTFLSKIPKTAVDGRVHASFNQMGTETGRFSSSGPNLQQIPKDQHFFVAPVSEDEWEGYAEAAGQPVEGFAEYVWEQLHAEDVATPSDVPSWKAPDGRWFSLRQDGDEEEVWEAWVCRTRNAIRAKPGRYIVEADYSQIELRVFAGESQEPALITAFETGEDVHTRTASVVYGVSTDQVTKKQRGSAKTINFGIIYGATAKRISESEGIPFRDAEILVRNYFANLPKAKSWIDEQHAVIKQVQHSRTKYGRIRSFEHLLKYGRNSGPGHIAMAEREGVNAIIQGTAADIMKLALVRLHGLLRDRYGDDARLVMTVHDSIVLEVHDSIPVASIVEAVRRAMVFDIPGYPPMAVDVQVGVSWGEGHEVEDGELVETPSAEETAVEPVSWILELHETPTDDQMHQLREFLLARQDGRGGTLTLLRHIGDDAPPHPHLVPDQSGGAARIQLAFSDESLLRRMIGACRLRQAVENLDARGVLAGIDDNAIFSG